MTQRGVYDCPYLHEHQPVWAWLDGKISACAFVRPGQRSGWKSYGHIVPHASMAHGISGPTMCLRAMLQCWFPGQSSTHER